MKKTDEKPHEVFLTNKTTTRNNRYQSKRIISYTADLGPFPTEQQHKEKVDVNNIIKKYRAGNEITHLNRRQGVYADLSMMTDYHDMVLAVDSAQRAFDDLPAKLRSRFNNDPSEMLAFLNDPKNKEEAISLGLVNQTDTLNRNEPNETKSENVKTEPKKETQASSKNSAGSAGE